MRSLILTGALGAGKTTLQRALVERHEFWSPATVTTRSVDPNELDVIGVSQDEFRSGVVARRFVLPAKFGGNWYGWRHNDLARICSKSPKPAVANVRPYTALLLSALIENSVPVWIWVEQSELERRRAERAAARDEINSERLHEDHNDKDFEDLFLERVRSDDHALKKLLNISKGPAQ